VQDRIKQLEEKYKGITVIIGVDRLDYIKGLTQKLKGYDYFLDRHPELRNKVVLIQVAVPSREDVKEYQELETELSTMAGKINGKHCMYKSYSIRERVSIRILTYVTLNSHSRWNPPPLHASLCSLHRAYGVILHRGCLSSYIYS
jgi:hypothetical protein